MSQATTSGPWERFRTPVQSGKPWERFSAEATGDVPAAQPSQVQPAAPNEPEAVKSPGFIVPGSMPATISAPPEAGTLLYPEDQAAQELRKHTSWLERAAGAAGQGLDEGVRIAQSRWKRVFQEGPAAFGNLTSSDMLPEGQPGIMSPQSRDLLNKSLVTNPAAHAAIGTAAGLPPTFATPEGVAAGPIAGRVAGAVGQVAGPMIARTAGSAAGGAAFMGGGAALEGREPSDVAIQAAIGGVLGAGGHAAGELAGAGVKKLGEAVDNRRMARMPEEKLAEKYPGIIKPDQGHERGTPMAEADIKAGDAWAKAEADAAEGKFPDKLAPEEAAAFAAENRRDFGDDTALGKAAEVQHQKKNLDLIDHGGDSFVKVEVPIDQFEVNNREHLDAAAVSEFAKQKAETAPPVFAGPPKEPGGKPLLLIEGRHRVAAAEARGESTVSAYVPEKWAKEAGLLAEPRRRGADMVEAKGTTFGPETSQIDVNAPVAKSGLTPLPRIQTEAAGYAKSAGLDYTPPTEHAKLDPARAKEMADAYDAAQHTPNDPAVKASYDAFKKETLDQWTYLKAKGVKFEPWTGEGQPYKNSAEMRADAEKGHLYFFQGADLPTDHPLAAKAEGDLTYNDVFRAVHDYFGHAKDGNQFGPRGEEHAWAAHSALYSPDAQGAMTAETRGQNSWVNFGPKGEANRANPAATQYAPQKATLLPQQFNPPAAAGNGGAGRGGAVPPRVPAGRGPGGGAPGSGGGTPPSVISHPEAVIDTLKDWEGRLRGYSLPKLVRRDAAAGEAGIKWASAKLIADAKGLEAGKKVLESRSGDEAFRQKLGAVLVEDNLRRDRQMYQDAGKTKEAQGVTTLVGPGRFFSHEAEYRVAMKDPEIQAAIARDKQHAEPVRQQLFAAASPKTKLHPGGLETGVHISLQAVEDGSGALVKRAPETGGSFTEKSLRRKSPFARRRTGSANEYELDYQKLLENSLNRNAPAAFQRQFYKTMVDSGLAQETGWADRPVGPEWGKTFKTEQGRLMIVDIAGELQGMANQNRYLTVKKSVESEVKALAENTAEKNDLFLRSVADKINTLQLSVGFADNVTHNINLFKTLFTTPGVGTKLTRAAGAVGGAPKLIAALDAVFRKAWAWNRQTPEILQQHRELAEIGAMRSHGQESESRVAEIMRKPIEVMDRASRLALDDSWKWARDHGMVEDTLQSRREWINQAGQYNMALQGKLVRSARQAGIGPFATAGTTFNRLGVRQWFLDPGVKAPGVQGALKVRLAKALVLGGTVGQIALLNQMLVGSPLGRKGVPLFAIDTGKDDERGNPEYIDALDLLTGLRRGARTVGMNRNIEAVHQGGKMSLDNAIVDAVNANTTPFIGPSVSTAMVALTGQEPRLTGRGEFRQVAKKVGPDSSQQAENIWAATKHSVAQVSEPGADLPAGSRIGETLKGQFRAFMPQSGRSEAALETAPDRERYSRQMEYADDLYRRAMQLSPDQRIEMIEGELEKQSDDTAAIVHRELFVKRKIMHRD